MYVSKHTHKKNTLPLAMHSVWMLYVQMHAKTNTSASTNVDGLGLFLNAHRYYCGSMQALVN